MNWLKRNQYWAGGGAVALALFALAGWFLYGKIAQDKATSTALDETTEELRLLVSKKPHPGTSDLDNIAAAIEDEKELAELLKELKQAFPQPVPSTNVPTSQEFRKSLDTSRASITERAAAAGVQLPAKFWFSFEPQADSVAFATNSVGLLAAQLDDVRGLLDVVLAAKPAAITSVKRFPVVSTDDSSPMSFHALKPVTNRFAVYNPYEVTFHGFSDDLPKVLEGFRRAPNSFIVRNISLAPVSAALPGTEMVPVPTESAIAPARPPAAGVVLQEKLLRITLEIDSLRFKPST